MNTDPVRKRVSSKEGERMSGGYEVGWTGGMVDVKQVAAVVLEKMGSNLVRCL